MIEGVIELARYRRVRYHDAPQRRRRHRCRSRAGPRCWTSSSGCAAPAFPSTRKRSTTCVGVLYVKDLLPELAGTPTTFAARCANLLREPWFVPKTNAGGRHAAGVPPHPQSSGDRRRRISRRRRRGHHRRRAGGNRRRDRGRIRPGSRRADPASWTRGSWKPAARRTWTISTSYFGAVFPEPEDYDTIGGLLVSQLGRIPQVRGDADLQSDCGSPCWQATRRRVERVRLERLEQPSSRNRPMPSEKVQAIVIRVVEFSETSCVVTLFTREFGKISGLAKGARRPKSPFESALDLLAVCRIVFLHKSSDAPGPVNRSQAGATVSRGDPRPVPSLRGLLRSRITPRVDRPERSAPGFVRGRRLRPVGPGRGGGAGGNDHAF